MHGPLIPIIGSILASVGASAAGAALAKTPKLPGALPTVQRDDARAAIAADDELLQRRGAASDILFGSAGAGAPVSTGKLVLGA